MNKLTVCTLTLVLSTLTFAPESRAATIAPPLEEQVKQAAEWFTGSFDNAQQIASNPSVPFINLSSCKVQLNGSNPVEETQNIYLEQKSSAFNRVRFYSFSKGNSAVTLSVRSFVNQNLLSGICNNPESERIVNVSNIVPISCNLEIIWQSNRYTGTNAPNGCPTSSGGKVVSELAFWDSGIDSLDRIFDARGNLIVNTPIQFRRIKSIPESSFSLGLLAIGIGLIGLTLKRKSKQNSISEEQSFMVKWEVSAKS
jgi:CpeT/CpcT family (DUF1001)